ncbi:MAG: prolyl oligopeptidase family serine peptidase [Gammaproteobacteria bacterium]|nr:prolyl oligopeptidase family serine peptidase [Gammaproteobacteria bacterium]
MNNLPGSHRVALTILGFSLAMFATNSVFGYAGELPRYLGFDLSPNGARLLMLVEGHEGYELSVLDLATFEPRLIYRPGADDGALNWCRWGNDKRIVCSLRFYKGIWRAGQVIHTRLIGLDHDGGNLLTLVPGVRNVHRRDLRWDAQVQDRVIAWLPEDPEHILLQLNRDRPNRPGVYRLNIYDNRLSRVMSARSAVRRWFVGNDGNLLLAFGYDRESNPLMFRVEGQRLRPIDTRAFAGELPPSPLGFSLDGRYVYLNATNGGDRHGIYRVRMSDGGVDGTIFEDPEFDVFGQLVLHPTSGEPVGLRYLRHHPTTVWFDESFEGIFADLAGMLPGKHFDLVSADRDYSRMVVTSYGGIAPRHYLYDRTDGSLRLIGYQYPELTHAFIADLEPVTYEARDGLAIPGYLALPENPEGGRLPVIVFPHGGPYDRDSAQFDYWTQFFVGLGYAVLKPNYRGSIGYGQVYMRAGFQQWGLKMQDDVMDGLDWLVEEGIADPERACLVGSSYGGYMALVSSFKAVGRIRCAVSLAGISDLRRTVVRMQSFDLVERNRSRIQYGPSLLLNSPLHQVRHIGVPLLIVHGDLDSIVGVRHSRDLARALAAHDKPFEYLEQAAGDHYLSARWQRMEFFATMGRFLETHLGGAEHRVESRPEG